MTRCLIVVTIGLTMGIFSGVSSAQYKGGGSKGGGGGGGGGGAGGAAPRAPRGPTPAQQAQSQLAKDQVTLTAAEKDYKTASDALQELEKKLHSTFEQTSEYKAAIAALNKAKAELDAAIKSVLGNLARTNPDYLAAKNNQEKAEAALSALKSDDSTPEIRTPLAAAKAAANIAVTTIEKKAMSGDPTIKAARDKVAAAQAVVDQLDAQYKATYSSNADWMTAKQTADEAQQKLNDAKTRVADDKSGKSTPSSRPGSEIGGTIGGAPNPT